MQIYIKKFIRHAQVDFPLKYRSIDVIKAKNGLKDKNHMTISIETEKVCVKFNLPS